MTDQIIISDKVIMICDKFYIEKSNSRQGGVGWETMIIQGDMLSSTNNDKYIAIMREGKSQNNDVPLPIFMKSKYCIKLLGNEINTNSVEFKKLLISLFNCQDIPKIGNIPAEILNLLKKNKQNEQ